MFMVIKSKNEPLIENSIISEAKERIRQRSKRAEIFGNNAIHCLMSRREKTRDRNGGKVAKRRYIGQNKAISYTLGGKQGSRPTT